MKSWLALIVAPSTALAAQSVLYSLVTPACSTQTRLQIHLVAAVALAITVVLSLIAYGESSLRHAVGASFDSDEPHQPVRKRFLADMATAVGALAALVILAMWFATWVLTPCDP
jgi:hypothetical protein